MKPAFPIASTMNISSSIRCRSGSYIGDTGLIIPKSSWPWVRVNWPTGPVGGKIPYPCWVISVISGITTGIIPAGKTGYTIASVSWKMGMKISGRMKIALSWTRNWDKGPLNIGIIPPSSMSLPSFSTPTSIRRIRTRNWLPILWAREISPCHWVLILSLTIVFRCLSPLLPVNGILSGIRRKSTSDVMEWNKVNGPEGRPVQE